MRLQSVDVSQSEGAIRQSLTDEASPLLITKDGKPLAALVPLFNADSETVTLSLSSEFQSIIERSRGRLEDEGGISGDEMERRLS